MARSHAVIFDMDGLMLDTESLGCVAYRQTATRMGYPSEDAIYLRTVGRNWHDTSLILREIYGERFPYEEFLGEWRSCLEELTTKQGIAIKPGLTELLDYLEPLHHRQAVATSTRRVRAERLLQAVGIFDRFHAIICGDEVSRGKPAPDIFLKAAETLRVSPSNCIVLEDSEAGTLAAHAAGMRVIVVPDLKHPSQEIAQLAMAICTSLHEARSIIATHLTGSIPV